MANFLTNKPSALDNIPADNQTYCFLATVTEVFGAGPKDKTGQSDLPKKEKPDSTSVFNGDDSATKNSGLYGSIKYKIQNSLVQDYAIPFDKNIIRFPIIHETVLVIKTERRSFWLPFGRSLYPNYHRDLSTFEATKLEYTDTGLNATPKEFGKDGKSWTSQNKFKVNHKIKFLKPKQGDTFISGRWGQTIRFSEMFLTEDDKTSSPSIFIRNFQNPELDDKPTGELVEEDFNKDGSSIYVTSNKVKIPYLITEKDSDLKKLFGAKKAYGLDKKGSEKYKYPKDSELNGHQIFMNTDRILLSAKSKEFLIFGQKQVAVFSGGRFSVDAAGDIYMYADKAKGGDIIMHAGGNGKQIFLKSDGGEVYCGKNDKSGMDGSAVQQMVLGGELVKVLSDLIDEINKQWYPTPSGPTPKDAGPLNKPNFIKIQKKLKVILSESNFLSKNK